MGAPPPILNGEPWGPLWEDNKSMQINPNNSSTKMPNPSCDSLQLPSTKKVRQHRYDRYDHRVMGSFKSSTSCEKTQRDTKLKRSGGITVGKVVFFGGKKRCFFVCLLGSCVPLGFKPSVLERNHRSFGSGCIQM